MGAETCAVLVGLYPIVLLTVVLERRGLPEKVRRLTRFRIAAVGAATASLLGIVLSVAGVEAGGLIPPWSWLAWLAFSVALLGLVVTMVMYIVKVSRDEDAISADRSAD